MASAASIVVSNTSTKTAADDKEVLILALRGGENVKTERDFRGPQVLSLYSSAQLEHRKAKNRQSGLN